MTSHVPVISHRGVVEMEEQTPKFISRPMSFEDGTARSKWQGIKSAKSTKDQKIPKSNHRADKARAPLAQGRVWYAAQALLRLPSLTQAGGDLVQEEDLERLHQRQQKLHPPPLAVGNLRCSSIRTGAEQLNKNDHPRDDRVDAHSDGTSKYEDPRNDRVHAHGDGTNR